MHEPGNRGGEELFRLQKPALVVGVIALALLAVGAFTDSEQFFRSYLMGWIFVFMISAGALAVLMIHNLTGGRWGHLLRRPAEAAAGAMPLVALAFLPILLGMTSIYAWAVPENVAHDALLKHKEAYLNPAFFTGRAVFYFVVLSVFALLLIKWGRSLDETRDGWVALRMRKLSGFGLLATSLILTFASIDWQMSLEPHWFSSMYALSFAVGCLLTAWAFLVLSVERLSGSEPYGAVATPMVFRDFGNLMLAFVMLWAYLAFSQFLLIWYGNLREEAPYYVVRSQGTWGVIGLIIVIFHFFLPFFLLLMRPIKDRPRTLAVVAVLVLVMRAVDIFWITAPAWVAGHGGEDAAHGAAFHLSWMDPVAFIAMLGLFFALYTRNLGKRSLLPPAEAHAQEAVAHG
jgi:hypothetical protein